MSINHLNSTTPIKLNVSCNDIECKSLDTSGAISASGYVDDTAWVSAISEPDSPFKDLLYGWTGLSEGTARSSIGTITGTRSQLLGADSTASIVTLKGMFSSIVQAGPNWYVYVPSYENTNLLEQEFVYERISAVDLTTGQLHTGYPTELNIVQGTFKIIFPTLASSVGNQIRVSYEYILNQKVPV